MRPVRARRPAPKRANKTDEPRRDTRSFVEGHNWVVEAALAFAEAVLGVGGFFEVPRRT